MLHDGGDAAGAESRPLAVISASRRTEVMLERYASQAQSRQISRMPAFPPQPCFYANHRRRPAFIQGDDAAAVSRHFRGALAYHRPEPIDIIMSSIP